MTLFVSTQRQSTDKTAATFIWLWSYLNIHLFSYLTTINYCFFFKSFKKKTSFFFFMLYFSIFIFIFSKFIANFLHRSSIPPSFFPQLKCIEIFWGKSVKDKWWTALLLRTAKWFIGIALKLILGSYVKNFTDYISCLVFLFFFFSFYYHLLVLFEVYSFNLISNYFKFVFFLSVVAVCIEKSRGKDGKKKKEKWGTIYFCLLYIIEQKKENCWQSIKIDLRQKKEKSIDVIKTNVSFFFSLVFIFSFLFFIVLFLKQHCCS